MASTNQSPFYQKAEAEFLNASSDEERLKWLDEMIKECPKHKSSERMLANLKTRKKKLLEKLIRIKKSGKSSSKSNIKKHEMQAIIIGKANSGKSSLLSYLTNTFPLIADYPMTTKTPQQGMLNFNNVLIQLIEIPAVESEYFDRGLVNSADTLIFLITNISEIQEIEAKINNPKAKRIITFNKKDLLTENEKRKISATLQSKKYDFTIISSVTGENIDELKDKIFKSFNKIRVYTKEPGKPASTKPIILEPNSNVKEIAEKILHGFSKQVSETKIWGPSSKFPGQKVSLKHVLKDLDIVEFKTR